MAIKDPTVTQAKKPDASKNKDLEKEEAAAAAATKEVANEEAAKAAEEAVKAVEEEAADSPEGKELYKLRRRYWNGRSLIPAGSMYYFVPGHAPKTAVNVKSGLTGGREREELKVSEKADK